MNEHYAAVLADLRNRRNRLEAELRDVDAAMAGIQRIVGESYGQPPFLLPTSSSVAQTPPHELDAATRYANISVRWAVLWHLAEYSQGYEKTGEIAPAILAGGYKTNAAQFGNMVSAVLSGMKAKGEVESNDEGGYRLTEDGRRTWQLIKQGTKFRVATHQERTLLAG